MLNQFQKDWKINDYRRWVDATPGAKLVIASRSGHNIQTERPQLVVDAIREVVSEAAFKQGRGATMKQLIWKDYRLNRSLFVLGAVVLAIVYAIGAGMEAHAAWPSPPTKDDWAACSSRTARSACTCRSW